jgi:STE24 endopeptidase
MLTIIFVILIAGFIFETILDYLNIKNWSPEVPGIMKDVFPDEKYKKARNYSMANYRFSTLSSLFSLGIMIVALAGGLFGKVDEYVRSLSSSPTVIALLFFGIIGIVSDLLSLPFSIYKTFVIEEKYGFNKTTIRTFITDKLKGYFLAIILGGLVLGTLVKVFEMTGNNFWWMTWIFLTVIMLLATIFYASWILPIFNKLTPLPDGELRQAIEAYSRKNGFPLKDIFVMDGSKRSSKRKKSYCLIL